MPKSKSSTSSKSTAPAGKKRTKDPHAPKRYRNAYFLFSAEKREEVKKENPGLSAKEVLSELGAQWKAADEATKQRFQKLSDSEKTAYEEKMAAYKSEKGDKDSANKENIKKKKSSKNGEIIDDGVDLSMED